MGQRVSVLEDGSPQQGGDDKVCFFMPCALVHSVDINLSLTRFESAKLLKRIIF